ncbi:hypothetical protein EVB81_142 [Rhizobium phage RHph_I46]|uniref:Uncharacterized protein n=1 Tax=Rhizobium phage RHph_I1_9 TaxID=2509729 RepID=A0A7S5UXP3_9CAUD|nr:hypothetical protein PP936_gp141 [Rhizobium phage RHph_I1_9]QIG69711.1 hypothetical protein EVB81_142 [Rhizobium phage RHph_I46]QIG70992.1 hypothetical protein EVB92_142 [Rhizobium phage RHph_I9]QIG73578.1 hypothetical protein EVC04_141 [Rhizobium phage RHph_I1_9]QIG76331.1 hypothetical protein EVC25_142 [Rhizobium phage RHph_I34]
MKIDISKVNLAMAIVAVLTAIVCSSAVLFVNYKSSQDKGSDQSFMDNKSIIRDSEITCPPPISLWENSK